MFDHKFQRPPLEVAASSGSVAGLKFLLDRGGRIDHVDREDGTTLLPSGGPHGPARGIRAKNPDAAQPLIDAAADLARTCPYPHIPPLIDELIRYAASRRAGKPGTST